MTDEIENEYTATEYRQNVGIVLLKNRLIFAGFRVDVPETSPTGWQMPQGGIDNNEDILTAGYRELYEETGIEVNNISSHMSNLRKARFIIKDGNDIIVNVNYLFKGDLLEFYKKCFEK